MSEKSPTHRTVGRAHLPQQRCGRSLAPPPTWRPNRARGKPVDRRADIWAYGLILYKLLTGKMVFGDGEKAHLPGGTGRGWGDPAPNDVYFVGAM
jgi:serine/threonine protein kinase